ncbi:unnamed protein product [Didymodactylos carnosus]|uniref:Major facilitator superfamily (MFS) profile domain-containing protein n=1 Tax=Didymodactylos carnosus TaxID=1234261 RepID=A0A815DU81_9BILA|nr:unnamed protein product [Didymodactylos carnosus]CAF4128465.1 unnamed protein product [Didymodactylos carnosus]
MLTLIFVMETMIKDFSNIDGKEEQQKEIKNVDLSAPIVDEISIYDIHTKSQRKVILFWISVAVLLLPLADTIYLPAMNNIIQELKTNEELVTLSVSIFLLFNGISSLIWGVISDRYGRNLTIRIGLGLFIIFLIFCVYAPSIKHLLIFRALQGAMISATMVVGQGVIADIYSPDERGWATIDVHIFDNQTCNIQTTRESFWSENNQSAPSDYITCEQRQGIFFVPVLLGVILGPPIGGVLSYLHGWRSTFVFLAIFSTVILVVYVLIIPETHQYKVLVKYSEKKIIESNDISEPKLVKPWLPFIHLTDLTILPYIISTTVAFACMIINQILLATLLTRNPYFFDEIEISISYIPVSIAEVIGCLLGGGLSDKANKYYTNNIPEGRLVPGLVGLVLIPIGLAMYGWGYIIN